ncbi:MAG: host-nuclease inhibitor Gam family protein [Fastidiosipilaceae bacterium]
MSVNLIETIEAFGVPEEQEQKERFKIEDKSQAAWALRKMSKIKAEMDENIMTAQAEMERIVGWRDGENEKLQRSVSFFEGLLHEYFLTLRESDPKLKTMKLPHGTLKMRKQQPQYEYDESLMLPWAKKNLPEAVVVKESVAKTPVKKHIKDTGEMVPGVEIVERPERFSVEVI